MAKINPKDKYIHFSPNTATRIKDGNKIPVEKQPFQDPDCGCGIDCCYGVMILPNISSTTGKELDYRAIYFVDGVMKTAVLSAAKAEIAGYRAL